MGPILSKVLADLNIKIDERYLYGEKVRKGALVKMVNTNVCVCRGGMLQTQWRRRER